MGLLSRKPKYSMEGFCRYFYDDHVFNPNVAEVKAPFYEVIFSSIVNADEAFKSIDFNKFREEMTAIRMELFGLAWVNRFKKERFTIPQTIFTMHYLEDTRRPQIRDSMAEYNHVLAASATRDSTGEQMTGRKDIAYIVYRNKFTFDIGKNWLENYIRKEGHPPNEEIERAALGCVLNRILVDVKRADCITVKMLTIKLIERLGINKVLNNKAMFGLSTTILGFYEGAEKALNDVDIQM